MAWILLKNQIAFLLMMLSGKFDHAIEALGGVIIYHHNFAVLSFPFPHTYLFIPLSKTFSLVVLYQLYYLISLHT